MALPFRLLSAILLTGCAVEPTEHAPLMGTWEGVALTLDVTGQTVDLPLTLPAADPPGAYVIMEVWASVGEDGLLTMGSGEDIELDGEIIATGHCTASAPVSLEDDGSWTAFLEAFVPTEPDNLYDECPAIDVTCALHDDDSLVCDLVPMEVDADGTVVGELENAATQVRFVRPFEADL